MIEYLSIYGKTHSQRIFCSVTTIGTGSRTNDAVQFRSLITSNDFVSLVIIFIIYA